MISMTQDQDQRGPGYVVRGDAVPENETDEYQGGQAKPMTRFQKVASALRGGTERDEQDQADADADAERDAQARRDYWDDPSATDQAATRPTPVGRPAGTVAAMDPDVPVEETNPDVPPSAARHDAMDREAMDHPATEPDMFGTTTRPAGETGTGPDAPTVPAVPAAEGQPGAATIADAPAGIADAPAGIADAPAGIADAPAGASVATATGAEEPDVPETAGSTGRHAAATPADRELRPGEGEAPGSLGDFSDLTYGNLIPDAAHYTDQWQQIQFRFVDDPHASVTEAADVVAQVTAKLEAAIQERQRAIEERQKAIAEQQRSLRDRWGEGSNADTENLRATLRMYKTFLDQLLGSSTR
jgi:hypothetical protein